LVLRKSRVPSDEVETLFARAMIGLDEGQSVSASDEPTGWGAIARLHRVASREALQASLSACVDVDPLKRRIGAAVLGQLGHSGINFQPVFAEERYRGLANLLSSEVEGAADRDVLNDACVALGHLRDPRAIPALLALRTHADARVRAGVVSGLSPHSTPEAVEGLISLSSDSDDDVRDWATFGLAQLTGADTPAVRVALRARLDDPCLDARNEAIAGLATRGDQTVIPVLIRELQNGVALPLLEAAIALASPDLCEALKGMRTRGLVVDANSGPYDLTEVWAEALRSCGCKADTSPDPAGEQFMTAARCRSAQKGRAFEKP
jgi:HEAT repeat protein